MDTPGFVLDPRLAADCVVIGDAPLCRWLLMDDAHYPWCILVPRRVGVHEIFELDADDRVQLMDESVALSRAMLSVCGGDKLNVAALGNVVAQLHVHHIVRRRTDAAWPAPVWGRATAQPYADADRKSLLCALRAALPDWALSRV
ncbi:MAG TPA: HIT domain-containing protein [Nevskiaceae bacterium]|nr:HIT domain-containing protein [Nevskiaceae bacterium]